MRTRNSFNEIETMNIIRICEEISELNVIMCLENKTVDLGTVTYLTKKGLYLLEESIHKQLDDAENQYKKFEKQVKNELLDMLLYKDNTSYFFDKMIEVSNVLTNLVF